MKKNSNNTLYNPNDRPNVYFNILGFIIPFAGFLIFLWEWDTKSKPIMAKYVAMYSIISFIMGLIYFSMKTFLKF